MVSPTKKRKLNGEIKSAPNRGLEYFFNRQKQKSPGSVLDEHAATSSQVLSDEELARKLQEEWNRKDAHSGAKRVSVMESDGAGVPQLQVESNVGDHYLATAGPSAGNSAFDANATATLAKTNTLTLQSVASAEDTISSAIPLDESPLTFNVSEYTTSLKAHWDAEGGNASYAILTRCFVLISATNSRIKIVDTLVNCLRVLIEADPDSLLPAVWLATNSISPPYISLELGLGGSAISKALKQVCGLDNRSLKAIYDKYGDSGDVAFEAKKKQSFTLRKPKPLTIKGVFQSLVKIAQSQGQGSVNVKQQIVDRLLHSARGGEESRFIVRTLCQHLRIGAVKTTMLIALSRAFLLSKPPNADFKIREPRDLAYLKKEELAEIWTRGEEIVKACFARRPNYNDLVPVLLEVGITDELLVRCGLALHIPLRPMLGSITRDLSEMLAKLQGREFACEFKYDGQRAQVHCDEKGKVSIFSRHLELMTDKYPDLVALIPKIRGEGVSSFILEGEVVAVDPTTGDLQNFQTLTNRARKDVEIGSITVNVCLFAFDLMLINGQPLLDRPFRERRELLRSLFIEVPRNFTWVKSIDATSQDSEAVLDFFKAATDLKCEGLMVKILDNLPDLAYKGDVTTESVYESEKATKTTTAKSKGKAKPKVDNSEPKRTRRKPLLATYEPDKRLDSWLKVKKDYDSTFDTLDLIPIAAWHGQGRKANWWSPILLAVRNEATGSLEAVTKCMSGFTDAFYKDNRSFYNDGHEDGERQNTRAQRPAFVEYSGSEPDVWFEPQEVWEVAFADITLSPTYAAAIGLISDERGLSMRFPRFVKKRVDKSIDEASTGEYLASLFRKQEAKAPTLTKDIQDEDIE